MSTGFMMSRVVSVLLVLFFAGCTGGAPGSTCEGDACPPTDTPRITTGIILPPIEYPLLVNRTLQFEDCRGGTGIGRLPVEKIREVVPEDFLIDAAFGFVPRVGSVQITAITCARVVLNTTILTNVSMLKIAAFVTPKEESWRGNGIDYYVLDTWFSAPELAEWFKPTRMPTEAATFDVEQLPDGSTPRAEIWNVDGANCDVSTRFQVSGNNNLPEDVMVYHWVGPKPYERMEVFHSWVLDMQSDASAFMIEGQCTSQRVFDETPLQGTQYEPKFNATWTINGMMFG